ncbi:MAG: ThuA domain-containing protein [Bacteroidota bacterium]
MKQLVRLICLTVFITAGMSVFAQEQKPQFKVVAFYTTNVEMDHANFANDALYFFKLIAGQQNFTFDATTDWSNMNDDFLSNYQIVIWLNNSPGGADQQAAFQRYMDKGGAWFGCHVSAFNLASSRWKWFNAFLGGAMFKSNNWPPLPAKLIVDDQKHPVTKRLPATFESPSGEWYQWEPSPRLNPDVKVLVTLAPENYPLGIKSFISGGDTPVVWTNTKYKMLYMNMGHGNKIFSNRDQNNMITDAVIWLGGGVRKENVR